MRQHNRRFRTSRQPSSRQLLKKQPGLAARVFHGAIALIAALTLHGASMPDAFAQAAPFQEYGRNPGLRTVNVLFPWGAGATGRGVTIALVDSGVFAQHADLLGQVLNGPDFVDGDGVPSDVTGSSHGTFIAGIIAGRRDGQGIVGVAYDSKILPVRIADESNFSSQPQIAQGLKFASESSAQIINLAIARGAPQSNIVPDALIAAAQTGKAIVMPAGNTGASGVAFPALTAASLDGLGIVAGAASADGQLANFSNRAGSLGQHYLVAPGDGVTSTTNDGGYTTSSGTSWATGYISGGLALLMGAFPNLSPREAIEILKISATDLGSPGVDSTFGWGLMNLQAAMAPEGELRLPGGGGGGGGGGGSGAAIVVAALAVGGGVAWYNARKKKDLKQAIILDGYDRGYTADITGLITPKDDNSIESMMQSLRQTSSGIDWITDEDAAGAKGLRTSFSWSQDQLNDGIQSRQLISIDEFDRTEANWKMSISGNAGNGIQWHMARNDATGSGFGLARDSGWNAYSLHSSDVFTGAYLGFTGQSDITRLGFRPQTRFAKFDLSFGFMSADEDTAYGRANDTLVFDAGLDLTKKARVNLQLSNLDERGSLLGGASNGALSPASSTTTAIGLSGRYRLTDRVTLMGALSHGRTSVVEDPDSMLADVSTIDSQTWGFGLVANALFSDSDTLGFAVSRPLKVTRGQATLNIPTALDSNRNIVTSSEAWNLAPSGSETDFEVFYRTGVGARGALGAHLLYQNDPFHEDSVDDRVSILATWRNQF